jgi:hypothetical protein
MHWRISQPAWAVNELDDPAADLFDGGKAAAKA